MSMTALFASFYFIPAAFFALGLWMVMIILRELGVELRWRRAGFTVLATVLLAPTIVPAGIIMTAIVPNGLLALTGSLPMLHQPGLVSFAALSFLVTIVVSGIAARFIIRDAKTSSDLVQRSIKPVRLLIPIVVVVALLTFHYSLSPDRNIPLHIDWALIESVYGERMDAVVDLAELEDPVAWQAERERLERWFSDDPLVLAVKFSDSRLENMIAGTTLNLGDRLTGSCSSTGDGKWRNDRIMRCSRDSDALGRDQTIKYRRRSIHGEHKNLLEIEFDYDKLLAQFSADEAERLSTGDEQEAAKYDSLILGTWSIGQRYYVTVSEERYQTGTLEVGPRRSFGTYSVNARVEVEGILRNGKDRFSRAECNQSERSCTWSESNTGTLRVRGSRVQIIYDNGTWMSDRLGIQSGKMIGIDDWGTITIFERKIVEPES